MKGARVHFSSASPHHATPPALLSSLGAEFGPFTLDPCPLAEVPQADGLALDWSGHVVYCNPPYGRGIGAWLAKGREAVRAVYLLPARTDTRWWHDHVWDAAADAPRPGVRVRFLPGRLKFGGAANSAPFPSVVVVMEGGAR